MKQDVIDLLNAISSFFIEKIDADVAFQNQCIENWCSRMPVPPTIEHGSTDGEALKQITEIHEYLCKMNAIHSARGRQWPGYVLKEFDENCAKLKFLVDGADVDNSICNLYHYHNAIGHRAKGSFDKAIISINAANKILQHYVDSSNQFLPRYNRNIILNTGWRSEFFREDAKFDLAIKESDKMLSMAVDFESNAKFSQAESKLGLSPIRSRALYFCCEAHLAIAHAQGKALSEVGEFIFSEAFGKPHYLDWDVPILVQVLRNDIWKEYYPHYYEKIADRIYVAATRSPIKKLIRELSVSAGRIRIKAPAALAAIALVLFLQVTQVSEQNETNASTTPQIEAVLNDALDTIRQSQPKLYENGKDHITTAKLLISEEAERFAVKAYASESAFLDQDSNLFDVYRDDSHLPLLTIASFGNEQGVGPGIHAL